MSDAMKHFRVRMHALHRVLVAAARQRVHDIDELARTNGAHVGSAHVARALATIDAEMITGRLAGERFALTHDEELEEAALRARGQLPLDQLADEAELEPFEREVLLLCAAAELEPAISTVLGYLQNDLARRRPTIGLAAMLTAGFLAELPMRRRMLGRLGRLRRCGLVRVAATGATEAEDELVLAPRVLDAILGTAPLHPHDPLELVPAPELVAGAPEPAWRERTAAAFATGAVSIVGVWGARHAGTEAIAHALASASKMRLRLLPALPAAPTASDEVARMLLEIGADAGELGQLLWIDTELLESHVAALDVLARVQVKICLTGKHPIRSSALLAARSYDEVTLTTPSCEERRHAWQRAIPELASDAAEDLAARYRLDARQLLAIARTVRTADQLAPATVALGARCGEVASRLVRKRSHSFAHVIGTGRGAADLVLAPDLNAQVLAVASAYRAWPRVRETWGLDFASAGLKALFTGEPGTGKTLAAEVIATVLGLPLVRIDLSQIVSKWVGETEKNLEAAFREAEDGNSVLFFDEAEALFGKRGEIRHGTDRYANLEVSYLLQRLEAHDGLVILASNLKDEIDEAFMRRFHAILFFPRPAEAERRRLWRLALPPSSPSTADLDLAAFARLDLTGAGIMSAARTAALRAADQGTERIAPADLVYGIAQQFQRESRLLTATDLGVYARYLS